MQETETETTIKSYKDLGCAVISFVRRNILAEDSIERISEELEALDLSSKGIQRYCIDFSPTDHFSSTLVIPIIRFNSRIANTQGYVQNILAQKPEEKLGIVAEKGLLEAFTLTGLDKGVVKIYDSVDKYLATQEATRPVA